MWWSGLLSRVCSAAKSESLGKSDDQFIGFDPVILAKPSHQATKTLAHLCMRFRTILRHHVTIGYHNVLSTKQPTRYKSHRSTILIRLTWRSRARQKVAICASYVVAVRRKCSYFLLAFETNVLKYLKTLVSKRTAPRSDGPAREGRAGATDRQAAQRRDSTGIGVVVICAGMPRRC